MRKILLKLLLFAVFLLIGSATYSQTALPGTIQVENGNVSNNSNHPTRNTVGSGNGGSNNIIQQFRKDGGIDGTIINNVSIAADGNYDFEFTYFKNSSLDSEVRITSTASDGSGATTLKTLTVVNNSATASSSSYGTVKVTNVPLTTSIQYITIATSSTLNRDFDLDNIIVTASAAIPVITLTGDNPQNITVGSVGSYSDPGATAVASDGTTDISANINIGGDTVDVNTVGTYTITYNVTDGGGTAADEVTRTVNVIAAVTTATQTGNWNDTATWGGNPVPTASDDVLIGNFTITVPPGVAAECNNLEIDGTSGTRYIQVKETGSLTVHGNLTSDRSNDGIRLNYSNSPSTRDLGSIIITGFTSSNGTSAGSRKAFITKTLPSNDDWHLISVAGTSANKSDILKTTGSNIVINNTKNIYSMASYNGANASGSKYEYFASGTQSGTFTDMGYSIKVDNTSNSNQPNISLKPRVVYSNFNETISDAGDGFNLVGNPFLAYVNANTAASDAEGTAIVGGTSTNLLAENINVLEEQTIWLWNNAKSGGAGWEIINLGDSDYRIHPVQGFFVKAKSTGGTSQTFTFKETMLSHSKSGGSFLKSQTNRFEIDLTISNGNKSTSTAVRFIDNMTLDFDNGYDSSMFGGYSSELEVYTSLLGNDSGKKLAIQSLPTSGFENMVIPVGVSAKANSEITFSANVLNIAKGYDIVLEDRLNNVFTSLTAENAVYTTKVSDKNTNGRFFLHVTSSVLSADSEFLDSVRLFTTNSSNVRVVGLQNGNATFQLFNVLGEQVFNTSFQSKNVSNISLPSLSSGVYIAHLTTESGKLNKKIVLE